MEGSETLNTYVCSVQLIVRTVVLTWVRECGTKLSCCGWWVVVVVVVGSQFGDHILWGKEKMKEEGPVRHNITFCQTNVTRGLKTSS